MPADQKQNSRGKQLKKRRTARANPAGGADHRGDVSSGGGYNLGAAKKEKTTARYRQASQEAYTAAPTARKRKILKNAKGVEGAQARKVHAKRLKRNAELLKAGVGMDLKSDKELTRGAAERDANVREARLKVLRQPGHNAVTSLKAELEGHGLLAAAGGALGSLVEHTPGGATGLQATKMGGVPGIEGHRATRFAKDIANLPAQALPSLYVPAAGAVEAAQGKPQRIKQFAKDIDKNDPLYNAGAAAVEAVGGDSAAAKKRLDTAAHSADAHPGFAFAEIIGAKGTLGRGSGRVLRSGVAGKTLKRVASTTREPVVLEGTGVKVHREYSPDVFTKGRQVLEEKHGTAGKRSTQVTTKEIQHRVDERVAVTGLDPHPFLGEFAARSPEGKIRLFTPAQIESAAADLKTRTGHDFVAQHADGAGDRRVLVPEVALDRLLEHRDHGKGKSALSKGLGVANDAFRQTVLSTSTSWAAGNVIEAGLRSGLAKAGPRSLVTGHKVMKRLEHIDPEKADELAKRVTGGGHYSLAEKAKIQSVAEHFADTHLELLANALHRARTAHGPKEIADLWKVWTSSVFGGMRKVESQFQKAQLGAEIRRSHLMDGNTMKLSDKAIDQAAQGLRDTNEQVRFARAVEEMYGKYGSFSPSMKHAVTYYTPFAAWFLNAVRFVTRTIPRDHPTALALTAAAENATQEWRKDHGLDLWMKGSVPGWLQGSIPDAKGNKYRVSRFTPFGAFGDLGGTLSGQVLPAYSGPLLALKGLSWNGQRLDYGDGAEGDKQAHNALVSIGEFVDATIPVVSQAKRIHEKGLVALNPLAPVSPKKKKVRRRKTSTAGGIKWSDQGGRFNFDSGGTWGDQSSGRFTFK